MKRLFYSFICFAVFAVVASGQIASEPSHAGDASRTAASRTAARPSVDAARIGVDVLSQRPMTISEVIELALANSKDIAVSRENTRSAKFDVLSARGAYDPRFSGQSYYDQTKTPNISIFSSNTSTTNKTLFGNVGLSGMISATGGTVSTGFTSQRVETNNPISLLSPQTNSNLNFSLSQPLFRGRAIDQTRRALQIAKANESMTGSQFEQKSIEIVTNAERAYWDLVFALKNLQVQRDGVRDATDQLEHNRRLVAEGQLAPNDILAAETQVALLEQAVFEAVDIVGRTENLLKGLIATGKDDSLWGQSIIPTDQAKTSTPATSLSDSLISAFANRPEMKIVSYQREMNSVDQKYFRDQTRPQIDFFASYSTAGVGGDRNPGFFSPFSSSCQTNPTNPSCLAQAALINGLVGSSIPDIWSAKYPSFRAGVTFNLSVGKKTAEGQLGKAKVQGEQLRIQKEQTEQLIQIDVRNAVQSLQTAEAKLRAATVARENSEKQYESEKRRLDAGQSDIYRVLERQTALLNAKSAEVKAQTELSKTVADYHRASGRTLEVNGIRLK